MTTCTVERNAALIALQQFQQHRGLEVHWSNDEPDKFTLAADANAEQAALAETCTMVMEDRLFVQSAKLLAELKNTRERLNELLATVDNQVRELCEIQLHITGDLPALYLIGKRLAEIDGRLLRNQGL